MLQTDRTFSLASVQSEEGEMQDLYRELVSQTLKNASKAKIVILKFADLKLKSYLCDCLRTG